MTRSGWKPTISLIHPPWLYSNSLTRRAQASGTSYDPDISLKYKVNKPGIIHWRSLLFICHHPATLQSSSLKRRIVNMIWLTCTQVKWSNSSQKLFLHACFYLNHVKKRSLSWRFFSDFVSRKIRNYPSFMGVICQNGNDFWLSISSDLISTWLTNWFFSS